ncbi:Arc family DNA-binding protein [Rhizobium esperanzae]|uniref:Arc family DNA-binding protein n=1 Tax=Rhizobium esperanzae TaxID=1967781 RepID=UPI0032B14B00
MQDTPSRKLEQYIVRFPDGMRDSLKVQAAQNGRSLNAEIVKRLQDTLEYDEHVARHATAPEPNEADYGVSFGDHLKSHPTPGLAKETLDNILDELRLLRSSILDVRYLPDGRRQVEFAPATRNDDDAPLPVEAFPAKDDPGYDEALLKNLQTIAARYGFDLVKKSNG